MFMPDYTRTADDERTVDVRVDNFTLEGTLALPRGAPGLVVFAHGSDSSRHSPRNRFVAAALREGGLATLLFDLLTPAEEAIDQRTGDYRYDIPRLASRLTGASEWLNVFPETRRLRLGYFGASAGAAAALVAAADRPELVSAIVARGGRPDLAAAVLSRVQAPTLLLVGGEDEVVADLNREALAQLVAPKSLELIPNATHSFEEPGALEAVADHARRWFEQYLAL
jgi:putative phosphoribosyl transferase